MVQRMIAVYAFVFALVQMGQQRKTKAFLFTAFGWMEWKIFIINGEKDYHEHTRHRVAVSYTHLTLPTNREV